VDTLLQMGASNALMATVFAILVAGIGRLCRRPALLHCLWLLVLLKLLMPSSLIIFSIPWPDEKKTRAASIPAIESATALDNPEREAAVALAAQEGLAADVTEEPIAPLTPSSLDESLPPSEGNRSEPLQKGRAALPLAEALAFVWLAGSLSVFTFAGYRIYRFCCLFRCARPAAVGLCEQVQLLAQRVGLTVCPTVWLLPGHVSPMVWALGSRPRLLVSSGLWDRLTLEQQTTLLIHELAHLRRRDHWVRGLELVVTGLYWWHPVVWWACRQLREVEEQCCDAWVLWTLPRSARTYATALLQTIDFLSETQNALPAVASGIGHVHDLRRRLTMIMHGTTPRGLSTAGAWIVLGLGAVLLALGPGWAQTEPRSRRAVQEAEERDRAATEASVRAEQDEAEARVQDERAAFERERERLAKEVEAMKANVERAMSNLRRAEERLAEMQERGRAPRETRPRTEARTATARGRSPERAQGSDPERRISELERKLDDLLNEVQSLRREMRRAGPGGPPGIPGAMPTPAGPRPGTPGRPSATPAGPGAGRPPTAPTGPGAAFPTPAAPIAPGALGPRPALVPPTPVPSVGLPGQPVVPPGPPEPPTPEAESSLPS
jgi:beta-lactamase regulating signal transducer with metallopeptidase domain